MLCALRRVDGVEASIVALLVSYMPLALQQCELEFLAVTKPDRSVLAPRGIAAKKII